MASNLQQIVQEQIRALSEEEVKRVLDFMKTLRKDNESGEARPISVIFEELSSEIPLEEWEELPNDGAENHDHYLYGSPKKTE